MSTPVICFGQQPCGFFPKRFLIAKINTARALQKDIGGKIVFFYHDSDADYRETITVMIDRQTGAEVRLNFTQENKLQKKYSPLYLKRIPLGWKEETLKQLPRFMDKPLIDLFASTVSNNAADFCLDMYKKMGLLEGIEILRSSDKNFRETAPDIKDFYADIDYQGEIVRAKIQTLYAPTTPSRYASHPSLSGGDAPQLSEDGVRSSPPLQGGVPRTKSRGEAVGVLHEGGDKFINFPILKPIEKWQKNPGRDERFFWMNSVISATHYIFGEGEKAYLKTEDFPEVKFIDRDKIEDSGYAWLLK